ncbi:hypothetical protein [Kitasatospora sp. NPDC093806]|uniref:hypothetical protein n=1 Tax=Kitasatospora sp. NPDC093806 TaxID=3155075 RepID=UPI00342361DF
MTVLHTVRLAPADGLAPSAGAPAALFEARVHSPAGVCHGLLTSRRPTAPHSFVDEHLAVDLTDPDAAHRRHHADVLHLGTTTSGRAVDRLTAVLRTHPGCAVATADCGSGVLLVLARTGGRLALRLRAGGGRAPAAWQRPAVGSLAHAWLAAGRTLAEITALAASPHHAYELLDDLPGRAERRSGPPPGPGRRDGGLTPPPGRPPGRHPGR